MGGGGEMKPETAYKNALYRILEICKYDRHSKTGEECFQIARTVLIKHQEESQKEKK